MTAWRLSPALVTLRAQLDAAEPNRDRRSDGTIGDAAHAARTSEHNPDAQGIVCAFDGTHGPYWKAPQLDVHRIVEDLANDTRSKYTIFEGRIKEPGGPWKPYHGPSPHREHFHQSVTQAGKNDPRPWNLPGLGKPAIIPTATPAQVEAFVQACYDTQAANLTLLMAAVYDKAGNANGFATLREGDSGDSVRMLQGVERWLTGEKLPIDGAWGPATTDIVRRTQQWAKAPVTGVADPAFWQVLRFLVGAKAKARG